MSAHKAPTTVEATMASGNVSHQGSTLSKDRQTMAMPRPAI